MRVFASKVQRLFAPLERTAAADGADSPERWIIKTGPLEHRTCQSFELEALAQFGIKLSPRTLLDSGWHGGLINGQREQLEKLAKAYSPPVVLEFVRPNGGLSSVPATAQNDRPAQLPLPNLGSVKPVEPEPTKAERESAHAAAFRDN